MGVPLLSESMGGVIIGALSLYRTHIILLPGVLLTQYTSKSFTPKFKKWKSYFFLYPESLPSSLPITGE